MQQNNEVTVNGEKVFLRKDVFGWRTVYPVKIDGKINKKNLWLGSRKVIIVTIIWLLIMGAILYGVNTMVSSCRDLAKNPCKYTNLDCSNKNYEPEQENFIDRINNIPIIKG